MPVIITVSSLINIIYIKVQVRFPYMGKQDFHPTWYMGFLDQLHFSREKYSVLYCFAVENKETKSLFCPTPEDSTKMVHRFNFL